MDERFDSGELVSDTGGERLEVFDLGSRILSMSSVQNESTRQEWHRLLHDHVIAVDSGSCCVGI